jgi:nucleotide-binding universal stress UspA family protein
MEEAHALALQARTRVLASFPAWDVQVEACADSPAWAVIKKADSWQPDLIVVGSHGRSALGRILLGSVSQADTHTVGDVLDCGQSALRHGDCEDTTPAFRP